jgi:hypothetical protein
MAERYALRRMADGPVAAGTCEAYTGLFEAIRLFGVQRHLKKSSRSRITEIGISGIDLSPDSTRRVTAGKLKTVNTRLQG